MTEEIRREQTPYETLRETVISAGLYKKRSLFYVLYTVILSIGYAGALYALTLTQNPWLITLDAVFLGIVSMHIGFLGHDVGHGQLFSSSTLGRWVGSTIYGLGLGVSLEEWYDKHHRHHKFTNQIGKDPDIELPFVFSDQQLALRGAGYRRYMLPRQHWYFFIGISLAYFSVIVRSIPLKVRSFAQPLRLYEIFLAILHFGFLFWFVFGTLGIWEGIVFFIFYAFVTGTYAGYSFAPNHKGEEVLAAERKVTYITQITSTRNIAGGPVVDFLMGGLNLQIEHHLFSDMPQPNLRKARVFVKAFCEQEHIPYKEVTLFESLQEMYRSLRHFALKGSRA